MRPKLRLTGLLLVLILPGCARALREPPPPSVLAGAGGLPDSEASGTLLARAEALFSRRELEAASEAARLFSAVAASAPDRLEAWIGAVRTRVWICDHHTDARSRDEAATAAVHSAQWCVRTAPRSPECAYWLGAALGVQARERPSTGLSALPRIVDAFARAASEKPAIERGGPDRALALLYVRAPGWPRGPGDPDRGLEHARKAVALDAEHPPNRLALAEALAATGDEAGGREAARRALELAREQAGDPDAPAWIRSAEEFLRLAIFDRP